MSISNSNFFSYCTTKTSFSTSKNFRNLTLIVNQLIFTFLLKINKSRQNLIQKLPTTCFVLLTEQARLTNLISLMLKLINEQKIVSDSKNLPNFISSFNRLKRWIISSSHHIYSISSVVGYPPNLITATVISGSSLKKVSELDGTGVPSFFSIGTKKPIVIFT
ncbi:hypothetical protein BpHYR1_013168 [Brachionus plicatilis]|uniref:Uncharacterized protein n=1 Tax=Brachionus plicatilis TaxID=10195 RepID=A0A3M7T370_BRAPC|nr:hypothetical protein BpHYR1_013168 [Brachionus plicatilis]